MVEFYQTGMGRKYYEHDLPELNRQLKRIADQLEKRPSVFIEPQLPIPLSTAKGGMTFKEAREKHGKEEVVVVDKKLIENMSEKEAAEFITKLVPEAKIAKKDNLPSTIKMRRMSVEQSLKETDWLNDNGDDGSAFGAVVAVYAIELDSKVYGELYITEYESGQFWTCMHNGDEAGTLTKCIQFLQEQA